MKLHACGPIRCDSEGSGSCKTCRAWLHVHVRLCSRIMMLGRQSDTGKTTDHRDAFEEYIKSSFLNGKNPGSKTLTRSKGERVTQFLLGRSNEEDAHFKFWVKSREFKLMDYPALGLHNILCVPAKSKVYYT